MEFTAKLKNLRVAPRKLRLMVDVARGKAAQRAIDELSFMDRKYSGKIVGLLRSAVNNASQNRGTNVDRLYVKRIHVDPAPTAKRFMTRARGSAANIIKRSSHVTVVLDDEVVKKVRK